MLVNGIIAEYNPFHNGHKYQLEESLHRTEADYTVIVMSGNFVQRGAPALLDKFTRAKMALESGADLVLELPALYAGASAEYFATGAVSLLDKLGVISHLCFGSECGEIKPLRQIALLLAEESGEYRTALKAFLKLGLSYPNARARALAECVSLAGDCSSFAEDCGDLLSLPNNILGIDYIRALLKRQSGIIPVTIKRLGGGHHDKYGASSSDAPLSALSIREALYTGNDVTQPFSHMPESAAQILSDCVREKKITHPNDFSGILYYKLLMEKENGYEKYLDLSAGLSDRIVNHLDKFRSFEAFCMLLKTKDMTYTRISRSLLHILLGIEKAHMEAGKALDYVPYARVLGFRKSASPLLSAVKKHSCIPLITKLADAEKSLPADAGRLLKQDILISEIYRGVTAVSSGQPAVSEYTISPVIL